MSAEFSIGQCKRPISRTDRVTNESEIWLATSGVKSPNPIQSNISCIFAKSVLYFRQLVPWTSSPHLPTSPSESSATKRMVTLHMQGDLLLLRV